MSKAIVLNADLHGIGDLCVTSWISEASKGKDIELIHYATGEKKIVLEMLGQKVCKQVPKMIDTFDAYKWELQHPEISRVQARASQLGFSEWTRPPIVLKPQYHEWAKAQHKEGKKLVLLFPRSVYENRCWPIPYWIDLAWLLRRMGYDTKVFLHGPDEKFKNAVPSLYHSQDWRHVAALMLRASLIIGNDSAPCHIGGTLGVPCLALMGPTPPNIFEYLPSVEAISNKTMECTGCFYNNKVYRPACNTGCSSLYGLTTKMVWHRAVEIIDFFGLKTRSEYFNQDANVLRAVILEDEYRTDSLPNTSDGVIVDIGAHIGSFTNLWKKKKDHNGTFACVEICPENWDVLKANVGEYATVFEGGCTYKKNETLLLNSIMKDGTATGGSILINADEPNIRAYGNKYWKDNRPIKKFTLEEVMRGINSDHIDLLKLDCEGSEYDILYNTTSLDKIRTIVGEYHEKKRFQRLIADRFSSDTWTLKVLRETTDDLGIFHLFNNKFDQNKDINFSKNLREAFVDADRPNFVDWLPRYQILRNVYTNLKPKSVLEIGVRAGYSALTFFYVVPDGKLIGIDFDGDSNLVNTHGGFQGAIEYAKKSCKNYDFEVRIQNTQEMTELPPSDLVYIDGDHTTEGCYHDLCLAAKSAKWIMCDDYDTWFGEEQLVRIAIDKFCEEKGIIGTYYDNGSTGLYLIQIHK